MNETELEQIKARAEAAIQKSWDATIDDDVIFIDHAIEDIPALLVEVERLTTELAEANSTIDSETKWADEYHTKWQETELERAKLTAENARLRVYEDLVEDEILPFCARLGMLHDNGDALGLYQKIKVLKGGEG